MLNHITIMGRLTRDPELRYTGSNTPVCSFTVAVDRDYADGDGTRHTDFIDCVAWKHTAEFVNKYFGKGSMIIVAGRLQLREWEDKDRNKRRSAEIIAGNVYFGESKKPDSGRDELPRQKNTGYHSQSGYNGYQATPGHGYGAFAELEEDDEDLPL